MSSYETLIARIKRISTLSSIGGLLGWDQETKMPPEGLARRADEKTLIASLSHEWFTDNEIGTLIKAAKNESLDDAQKANIREIEWSYHRAKAVPASWVEEFERATTEGVEIWKAARKKSDFALFAPHLKKIVDLNRQYAKYVAPERNPYEVLVETFENGLPMSQIDSFFQTLKDALIPLIKSIHDDSDDKAATADIPLQAQKKFAQELAKNIGYDFQKGRLDESTHPFTGYYGRITTRFEHNWISTLMSTIHESGHGMYEHGLPDEHVGEPLGDAGSFSVHESISRFWENNIGRSKSFWQWLYPKVETEYGIPAGLDAIYKLINKVQPGIIRVDADELTYTMHIILRFEMEKELMDGTLEVASIPAEWIKRMQHYLGIAPKNDAEGCLQDTHWASGMFGYFPCYTLGSMIAAQLFAAAQKDIPHLKTQIAEGNFAEIQNWLAEKIYSQGQRYRTADLIHKATGKPLSTDDYVKYLTEKFGALYSL
jgi:carboxypeptidase Taq